MRLQASMLRSPCSYAAVPATAHLIGPAHACMQVMEKGTKAFVSYVRGYKEHHCKYIFQLADLSLEHLGYMFGLLRLPVMKEVWPYCCCCCWRPALVLNRGLSMHR